MAKYKLTWKDLSWKDFKIYLLTANKNHNLLSRQIKEFNVKNVIVKDRNSFLILKLLKQTRVIHMWS